MHTIYKLAKTPQRAVLVSPPEVTMKLFLCVLATIACAQAFDNVDWSKVKHRDITPHFPFNYQKSERIVGGEEAVPNSLPYQVGMLIDTDAGTFFCGGSLISTKFVLTAAHCVEGANQIQVRLGAHRINDNEETQVRMISTKYNIHAGWDASTLTNDIATVELPEEVSLSDHIQLISLPTYHDANEDFNGHDGRISGWGLDSDSATSISPVLRFVWTTVISNFSCNLSYLGIIRGTHICTSGTGGLGSCSGDSGGPLSTGAKQIGIVSFGLGLGCEIGWPSAFTRVTSYLDWIESHSDVTINP